MLIRKEDLKLQENVATNMISIVIPSKEEPYLGRLVDSIHRTVSYPHEILVQSEPGLGSAVLQGIRNSKGNVIAILDGDGSHSPNDLNKMLGLLQTYQLVVGSRYIQGGSSKDTFLRRFLSLAFSRTSRSLLKLKTNDPMSGFVVAKRQVFETVKLRPIGYKFLLELLVKSKESFKISEYPITFEKRKMGKSKTGVAEGVRIVELILLLMHWKASHSQ
jgi:glycosyltransferase involved in cell wall biosynthesis